MKLIPLSGKNGAGKFVKVDDDDYEKFKDMKLHLSCGRYAAKGDRTLLHRIITNAPDGMVVDHKNHDTLDCRKKNLRICTQTENCKNCVVKKGYYWDTCNNKFNVQYRGRYFGRYKTEKEARRAWVLANSGLSLDQVKTKVAKEYGVF